MTTHQYLVTIHETGNITNEARNVHTILTSTDHITPRERVTVEPHTAHDRLFTDKVFEYVADPGFAATVRQYLQTMVDEYDGQTTLYTSGPTTAKPTDLADRALKLMRAQAKREAYRDAARVLDDAIDAACRYADEHAAAVPS